MTAAVPDLRLRLEDEDGLPSVLVSRSDLAAVLDAAEAMAAEIEHYGMGPGLSLIRWRELTGETDR